MHRAKHHACLKAGQHLPSCALCSQGPEFPAPNLLPGLGDSLMGLSSRGSDTLGVACFPWGGECRAGMRGPSPSWFRVEPQWKQKRLGTNSLFCYFPRRTGGVRLLKSNLPGLPGHSERQINHRSEVGGLYTLYEQCVPKR